MTTDPPIYNDLDYFPIFGSFRDIPIPEDQAQAINFNYILRTGDIRAFQESPPDQPNQTVDAFAQDALGCSIENIKNRVLWEIKNGVYNNLFQNMLTNDNWDKSNRTDYEYLLSTIVSEVVNDTPGFEEYAASSPGGLTRAVNLNDLSYDLECDAQTYETDCETFSIIEGCVIQMVENELLAPFDNNDKTSWKRPLSYFTTTGSVSFSSSGSFGGHRWIITPTGSVIEATSDPDEGTNPYYQINSSLELWARGYPAFDIIVEGIYGPYWLEDGDRSTDFKSIYNPYQYIRSDAPVTYTDDGTFALQVFEDTRSGADVIQAFQKMDVGTPDERYVCINSQYDQKLDETYQASYTDVLTGERYRFTADEFGRAKIQRHTGELGAGIDGYFNIPTHNTTPSSSQTTNNQFRENTNLTTQRQQEEVMYVTPQDALKIQK